MQLEDYRLHTVPSIYYVPDFLSEIEEASYIAQATATKAKWVEVSSYAAGRRPAATPAVAGSSGKPCLSLSLTLPRSFQGGAFRTWEAMCMRRGSFRRPCPPGPRAC